MVHHVSCCAPILAGLQDGDAAGGVVSAPQLVRLDWSGVAGLIALQPGTQLTVSNLDMGNFSLKSDYTYSPDTPYQSVGSGVSIWPTINGAPNTTVRVHTQRVQSNAQCAAFKTACQPRGFIAHQPLSHSMNQARPSLTVSVLVCPPCLQFRGFNITGSYYNPSTSDDLCPCYVEKTLAFLIQV